jgi:hypothetical protein
VAGDDDGDRVAVIGPADGPHGGRLADRPRDLPVARGLAEGDPAERRPDLALERGPLGRQRQLEAGARPGEVLLQLQGGRAEAAVVPAGAGARPGGVRIVVEVQSDQRVARADQGQAADGARDGGEEPGVVVVVHG